MPPDAPSLLNTLSGFGDRPLLWHDGQSFSARQLCEHAETLRQNHRQLLGANVALQLSDSAHLLRYLLAFDGFANRILLLPPCMAGEQRQQLLDQQHIAGVLGDDGWAGSKAGPTHAPLKGSEWLLCTSGTTGLPKVFAHRLSGLAATARLQPDAGRQYRWGLLYQPFRFAGIQVLVQAWMGGSTLVLANQGDPGAQIQALLDGQVNCLSATPSQWRQLLFHGGIKHCLLRQLTLGGEIADQPVLSALRAVFPEARLVHIYASTEAGVGFAVKDGRPGFPAAWLHGQGPVDLALSEHGTLLIRGSAKSHSEALNAHLRPDGYLDTQDSVTLDGERVLFQGRASGIINVGGLKVHPEEVEAVLLACPGVHNALVTSRSSSVMGALVAATLAVGPIDTDAKKLLKKAVLAHCREHLPKHKVPALLTLVDSLAVADSGKIKRDVS